MNNKHNIKALGFVIIGLFLVFMGCMSYQNDKDIPKETFDQKENAAPPVVPDIKVDPVTGMALDVTSALAKEYEGVSEQEKQSMVEMVSTLIKFGLDDSKDFADMATYLKGLGLDPWAIRNSSPEDSSMYFVRLKKRLPGTKNFHAQYMRDEGDQSYPQHIAFEFRPGPESFELAKDTISALYPNLDAPKHDYGTVLRSWSIGDGKHIYIRTIDQEFIEMNHPYNAYGPEDIGVIRIVIEEDIGDF